MHTTALNNLPFEEAQDYLQKVTFFKALLQANEDQHEQLLQVTQVIELAPGEVIIHKGSKDKIFYSVVKGKLDVFANDSSENAIGHVLAGQVVGGLSLISQKPKTATLAAARLSGAILLATDFSLFGEIDDFSHVDLVTKLCLFRNVVNYTNLKLDQYRHHSQNPELTKALAEIAPFTGEKGSLQELIALEKQALNLGRLLSRWNTSI